MTIDDITYSRRFLVLSDGQHFPAKALEAGYKFAQGFEKGLCLLSLNGNVSENFANMEKAFEAGCTTDFEYHACDCDLEQVCEMSERTETPIIFCEISQKGMFSKPLSIFKAFRSLRIPFVLVKENCKEIDFSKVIVPVAYLPEEKEKAPYSSNMGRFLKSEIIVLQAKDYGSKTPANVQSITKFYDRFDLSYSIRLASHDSYKVEKEAVLSAAKEGAGMVIISNSRDYGLDDIIFGPKELHLLKAATTPLMCINPRGDLYVLCW